MIRECFFAIRKNIMLTFFMLILTFFSLYFLFMLLFFGRMNDVSAFQEFSLDNIERFEITSPNEPWEFGFSNELLGQENILERLQYVYSVFREADEFGLYAMDIHRFLRIEHVILSTLAISQQTFERFGTEISLYSGRSFIADDFVLTFDNPISVLVGYHFKEDNPIGDRFYGTYFGRELEFEIIGILEPRQKFFSSNPGVEHLLDNLIVLPFGHFETPRTDFEYRFLTEWYGDKIFESPILVNDTPESINTMFNIIYSTMVEVDIDYRLINAGWTQHLVNEIQTINLVVHQTSAVRNLFVGSALSIFGIFLLLTIIKYNQRKTTYHTYVLLGQPIWKVMVANLAGNAVFFLITIWMAVDVVAIRSGLLITVVDDHTRLFLQRLAIENSLALRYMIGYGVLLFIIANIYQITRLSYLYKKGR